ncbi:LRR receptor-like serine/threonine-protein kinase FLS2 [Rosa rugosa]|uniref:LRR receptor-like serine/threonine-protein kinase FLS2 n=1 Tax=Rosa rugosa TaxID=74645 RepID=UPI002B411652|nr:LRR receptor-like serine/threonine-protein kinase FLS2 [Rosa rugosa]
MSVSCSIPREIGNLTTLKEIYLDNNNFIEIPNEIGALDQLEKLYVQENVLEGNVPMVVFNMSSLITLTLFGNNLKGRLPDNMCQNLPHIQILNFGDNQLEGPLPSIFWQCKQLVELSLEHNKFSGNIPKDIGNATQLKQVYLAKNNLTGSIPATIFNLSALQVISLRSNQLSGSIPREIGNLTTLKEIYLFDNNFTGTVSDEIGRLPNLVLLYLGFNNLNGHIPTTIFNKSTLVTIDLTSNQLSGNLPTNIGLGLPNLQNFFLGEIKLSGVIPKSISNASQLTFLELGRNFLSGFIPNTLCALTNLEWLSLFENNLTLDTTTPEVNVLSCLANLKNLKRLAFDTNPLNANLPISFRNLSSSLQNVYLYNCNMRGNIPDDIGNLSSLTILNMHDNKLSGSIPTSIGTLKNLQVLSLDGNSFQGHIADELCELQNLFVLSLHGNQLSGSIPSCLGHLATALRALDLGSNLLNSTIPTNLWGLSDLLYVYLSSNNLSGSLSEDVGNLKVIIEIDLSNNHLSGSIPSSIGNLQSMVKLSLENNKFEGLIPNSLGKSLSLEILDLSINNLSGLIPKSFESLKYLKIFNLSFNKLQGEIPTSGPFQNLSAQSFVSSGELRGASRFLVPSCNNRTFEAHLKSIISGILSALFIATFIWIVILRRRKNVEAAKEITLLPQLLHRRVSYLELVRATNAFNESNLLGSGGFGSVYKGTFSDGIDVAVKRLSIMIDVASALEYLHHGYGTPIVHCDLKPSNILLDKDMSAHVADFGIAKLLCGRDSLTRTITQATIGYMAPEYGMEGIVTRRGDVYSFGIVLMETFTRKKPTNVMFGDMSLKQWVANSPLLDVVDANLLGIEEGDREFEKNRECLSSIMRLALACSSESPEGRINMQEALATLNKIKIKFFKDASAGGVVVLKHPLLLQLFLWVSFL